MYSGVDYLITRELMVKSIPPMPKTLVFDPGDLTKAEAFFRKNRKLVVKRRRGKGVEN